MDQDPPTLSSTDQLDLGQLSRTLEVMQDAVVVYDARARILMVNQRLVAATGYSPGELVGRSVLDLIPRELREDLIPRMLAYATAPVARTLEAGLSTRVECKDGSTFDARVSNCPIPGPAGHVVVASIRNIGEVSLEEIQLRGMLEANPDATMICTPEGKMLLVNAGAIRLFEREHISLFNQDVAALFSPSYVPAIEEELRTCHESATAGRSPAETHTLEAEVCQRDKSMVPVEITISSLRTTQGHTLRVIVRDISERLRVLREAEAMKDGFLATVSHELRTPLTSVLGYGELLEDLEQDDLSEHARSLLDVVMRNARRELRLVDDLLTMVQIGEGTFRIRAAPVNLTDLVRQAVEAAAPAARRAEVVLSLTLCAEETYVVGDADRLGQAIDNLLTNSVKFSPASGEVVVELSTAADTVNVSVTNQGAGIPETDVEHVFERLYRGNNAVSAEKQGVGLGLSIVRSIVEAHAGTVSATSTATTTRFDITIPRQAEVSSLAPHREPGAVSSTQGQIR